MSLSPPSSTVSLSTSAIADEDAAELAQACERIFSGDFIAQVEVKQAALAWVPEAMRFRQRADEAAPNGTAGEQPLAEAEKPASSEQCVEIKQIEEAA